jgi:hypothetical protein
MTYSFVLFVATLNREPVNAYYLMNLPAASCRVYNINCPSLDGRG